MSYPRDPVHEAARAHTSLTMFGAIRSLAEGSDIDATYYAHCQRIIRACDLAMSSCLRDYDRWASVAKSTPQARAPVKSPGRRNGGLVRAAKLTPEQRQVIARKAAQARWGNRP